MWGRRHRNGQLGDGLVKTAKTIRTVAICGAGQMGTAAAVSFKRSGYNVLVWNHKRERLSTLVPAATRMESWLDENVGRSPMNKGIIETVSDLEIVDQHADLVLECIVENMEAKVHLFRKLGGCSKRKALFCTTTSGLSITELGSLSGCSQLLVGTHFWNPPHLMPLVEVIRGQDTPLHIVDIVCQIIESIGKTAVRVNSDVPGFIGNRLLHSLWREAINLVERRIATAEDVDLVAKMTFGLRMPVMGPLENMDLVGLDLVEVIHQYLLSDLSDNHQPSASLIDKVRRKQIGLKSGQGFYDWRIRSGEALIEMRNRQIVWQLKFLRELENGLDDARIRDT